MAIPPSIPFDAAKRIAIRRDGPIELSLPDENFDLFGPDSRRRARSYSRGGADLPAAGRAPWRHDAPRSRARSPARSAAHPERAAGTLWRPRTRAAIAESRHADPRRTARRLEDVRARRARHRGDGALAPQAPDGAARGGGETALRPHLHR